MNMKASSDECSTRRCNVTIFILEFVRSVVKNDFTERTDSLISVANNDHQISIFWKTLQLYLR